MKTAFCSTPILGYFLSLYQPLKHSTKAPTRLSLADVKVGENYAVIINSNAGMWAYSIGDTIKFISLNPYKIIVNGRIKHYISAFGEHVIGEEVEYALMKAANENGVKIIEFTVAQWLAGKREKLS